MWPGLSVCYQGCCRYRAHWRVNAHVTSSHCCTQHLRHSHVQEISLCSTTHCNVLCSESFLGRAFLLLVACVNAECKINKKTPQFVLCRGLTLSRRPVVDPSQRAPGNERWHCSFSPSTCTIWPFSLTTNTAGNLEHLLKICQ